MITSSAVRRLFTLEGSSISRDAKLGTTCPGGRYVSKLIYAYRYRQRGIGPKIWSVIPPWKTPSEWRDLFLWLTAMCVRRGFRIFYINHHKFPSTKSYSRVLTWFLWSSNKHKKEQLAKRRKGKQRKMANSMMYRTNVGVAFQHMSQNLRTTAIDDCRL